MNGANHIFKNDIDVLTDFIHKVRGKKMSLIQFGIFVEIFLFVGFFLWVRKLTSKKGRQPSLSKKTIKNLKF